MAYKTSELIKKAEKILKDKTKIVHFFEDLCDELGISTVCGYEHKINETNIIKDLLATNKRTIKKGLRKKWYDSENPTCQISLYKLTGTDEERKKLSQTYIDHTTNDKDITINNNDDLNRELNAIKSLIGEIERIKQEK